ncbi:MAG TPA: TrkA family potassium uptake protein [Anaerohalosphaeraceae bacterium]|nr:TrkA family potassium uptake protein [Phycisphaerae bacterium]HOK96052.1 TrkA family potassium uptake protein [Anaerohalosphaeraceae bacterium]HOL32022.1 TrkA family potassium uptake protein [Anaerohalosphaeraceae bacterium]HOM76555.1 TrkA family potassium uptake protein [Anaerohalosphaeraceae bacterium]HPC64682.1 TrkA family potassium uptake protein [Anaerohalosphaeraceae bacterium]
MKRFVVIGLGRFGSSLARALSAGGAEVIAIDRDREVIENIRDQVAVAIRLDSTDIDALKAQGIDRVDIAVVGMGAGHGFESAILTVVNLKKLGIPQIFARAENTTAGTVFTAIGATEVIYPEIETAQRWAYRLITPHIEEKIDFSPGYSLARVSAPASFDGKTVRELQLRQKYNLNLVAIKRSRAVEQEESGEILNVPMPETKVYQDDILMVAGADADLARLPQE